MKHELPELPFAKNALEPVMSAETLEYHYGRHHKAYVDKLNDLIRGTEFENSSLEEIVLKSAGPIFNNGAQVWNHTFFWNSLSPTKQEITGGLKAAIEKDFGSLEAFQNQWIQAATGQFGSGWVWLVRNDRDNKLAIETTSNADNPMRYGRTPLLTCDVWEHAYYIDYRNERPRFLKSVWQLLNWKFAEQNFTTASQMVA